MANDQRPAKSIVDAVLDALAAGRLPAGARLREEALAQIFSVGRTVVREALRDLALRGIVTLAPNRGAAVACPTPEEAEATYAARALIEGALARDLAASVTAADIKRLRAHLAEQQRTLAANDRRTHLRLMGEFHMLICRLHGNRVIAALLDQLVARTSLMTALYPPETQSCAIDDHEALIERLAAGDGEGAAALMERHLTMNRQRLRQPAVPLRPVDLATILRPHRPA
jgi:DNA-binding GntR family transcriptional regulator